MDEYGQALADSIELALPRWVQRCVIETAQQSAAEIPPQLIDSAREAGRRASDEVMPVMRSLLAADIDEQWTTPLALLRSAVRFPTAVLLDAGIPVPERDEFAMGRFPDDPYNLTPASFADVDPSVADPGLAWGASKAFAHKKRHKGGER